ncbi:MAG: antitoxin [Ignavibacteriales bacterium]|nr:MAG: antitoxin [Ignavibacteriales bacterium]
MDTAKIFENGKSQAVRLPKAYRLKGKEAYISKLGEAIILLPKKDKWDSLIASLGKFSDDFMSERLQPEIDKRDNLFI